jgi:Luciferase-like monooxygenase
MALKDRIPFGMSLPHRSPEAIDVASVRAVAQRAEALGFRDLWVTENTLDHVTCFDPVVVLTYAAAATTRIRLGASVVVLAIHSPLMVAHQWATLDHLSGGRAILGVGLGREHHYRQFEVPEEGRVARFREEVALIRALWTQAKVDHRGRFYHLQGGTMSPKPVQQPLPIWMGVGHPNAVRRGGLDRRRLDGVGWLKHCRVPAFNTDPMRGAGEGGARSGEVSGFQADLHGGGRTAGGGTRGTAPLVHRRVPQSARHGCFWYSRNA